MEKLGYTGEVVVMKTGWDEEFLQLMRGRVPELADFPADLEKSVLGKMFPAFYHNGKVYINAQTVEFVVMDNGDDFIQTSGGELQYRANGKNYRAAAFPVEQEKIKAAFVSYYRGDGEYLRNFEWEEIIYESLWTKIKKLFSK